MQCKIDVDEFYRDWMTFCYVMSNTVSFDPMLFVIFVMKIRSDLDEHKWKSNAISVLGLGEVESRGQECWSDSWLVPR